MLSAMITLWSIVLATALKAQCWQDGLSIFVLQVLMFQGPGGKDPGQVVKVIVAGPAAGLTSPWDVKWAQGKDEETSTFPVIYSLCAPHGIWLA